MSDLDNEIVMGALTNSYAYQCYNKSIESIKNNCKQYCRYEIKNLDDDINTYIRKGYLKDHWYLRYYPTYSIKGSSYITNKELSEFIEYFKNKGFIINYKIKKGFWNSIFNFKLKKTGWIKIYINWDFSNK